MHIDWFLMGLGVRTVLVVGAGIAGSTVAYWLGRHGIDVTVVERAPVDRSSGGPVDVRGPALDIVAQMGLLRQLTDAATLATGVAAVDARGRRIGWAPLHHGQGIEIPRSSLAAVLADAGHQAADFVYGDTITALNDDGDGVDVTFEHARPRRFDLVVGADGLHSTVRELAFGVGHADFLGLYVATANLDGRIDDDRTVLLHNAPGRLAAVHPATGQGGVAFIFRHPEVPHHDQCDRARQQAILDAAYAGMGWRVPELLELSRNADDMYFDSVSRIRLARWSTGRITVLGDAATCVSLLGDGSSLAIAGGNTLANAVQAHRDNPTAAFAAYEQQHRRRVSRRQRWTGVGAHVLVPASAAGISARNVALLCSQLLASRQPHPAVGQARRLRPDRGSTTRHRATPPSS